MIVLNKKSELRPTFELKTGIKLFLVFCPIEEANLSFFVGLLKPGTVIVAPQYSHLARRLFLFVL